MVDTLVVTAAGHRIVQRAISSYTGTNDFSLAALSGNVGFVTFDNASYSGCQNTALLTVDDIDLSAATVPVRVKSTADSAGFTVNLAPDTTAFGQYTGVIHFSINKSDSTKGILKVSDIGNGDMLSVFYHDRSPDTMLSMTGISWNGITGTVGPGASIYSGLTVRAIVNLSDDDLTDSVAFVTAKNDSADTVGILLTLHALSSSGGSYTGTLGFSMAGSNQSKGIIKVKGQNVLAGENITLWYTDQTPPSTQRGSICTWRPFVGSISFDSASYHGTSKRMAITLRDDDISDSLVRVSVKSKTDAVGIIDTLVYSASAGGGRIFTRTAGFSTTASQQATGVIHVNAAGDSVSVTYTDVAPDSVVVKKAAWSAQ